MLKYLCFIEPFYNEEIYKLIINRVEIEDFMKPYVEYFNNDFIKDKNINTCNYWKMYRNRTNNCCEGYNSKIKDLFKTKPHIYKLIIKLKDKEENIFKRCTRGEMLLLKKKT